MARTNLALGKWYQSILRVEEGLSTTALAKAIGVKWKTAAHMQGTMGMTLGRPGFFWRLRKDSKGNRHD
jgi:hypothetical protein